MSKGTYIYPNNNTEYEELLRKTDHLAYIYFQLHSDDPNVPEEEVCFDNMLAALEKYIDPKWDKRDVITLFEHFCANYSRIHATQGFKLGAEFTTRFFEDIRHPYYKGHIEALREYEWMKEPIRGKSEDEEKDDLTNDQE